MNKPKLYLMCGKARHGKDTFSAYLKEAYEKTISNRPEFKDLKSISTEQLCIELTNRLNNMTLKEYREIRDENNEIKTYLTDLKENLDMFVSEISGE